MTTACDTRRSGAEKHLRKRLLPHRDLATTAICRRHLNFDPLAAGEN